ncbi:glycosyltransferase family 4 protein [Roseobacter sp. YSTF-M11]|uniref:Glycosyltransferase family 4 protein n=1 Tax=Roseobacter insulae TaxID=2859783 RepID=A0A9X1G171_9RHOB|nr:glycosyltransferase family 4 protein [Roseobacter insulae]MBW4710800.1 glycosyltransferase family 4 protein [Roseobacter insulae]
MRITFVLPRPFLNGGMRVIVQHAKGLQELGHEVTLVLRGSRKRSLLRKIKDLFAKRRFRPLKPEFFHETGLNVITLETDRAVGAADVPDADVVIATWWTTAAPVAALPKEKGAKVYFVQDYGAESTPQEPLIETWQLGMNVITLCNWLADLVRQHASPPLLEIVPNGIDAEAFAASVTAAARQPQDPPTVGLQARGSYQKGTDIAAAALCLAAREVPGLRARSFGFSPVRGDIALPAGSIHHRAPSDEEVPRIYADCDLWLFPSRKEGFGLPILEALAVGTPVIATPAAAAPELISARNGALLDDFAPETMAAAIVEFYALPEEKRRKLSDAAWADARKYSWSAATRQFEAALEKAMAASG